MELLIHRISRTEFIDQYMSTFKTMSKAVVDVESGVMAVDAELHADIEALLMEKGSKQEDLWGINLYPFNKKEDFVEYTAMINIRPHQNNPSMEILDSGLKAKIKEIVDKYIAS
jgi:hypothetical protein